MFTVLTETPRIWLTRLVAPKFEGKSTTQQHLLLTPTASEVLKTNSLNHSMAVGFRLATFGIHLRNTNSPRTHWRLGASQICTTTRWYCFRCVSDLELMFLVSRAIVWWKGQHIAAIPAVGGQEGATIIYVGGHNSFSNKKRHPLFSVLTQDKRYV